MPQNLVLKNSIDASRNEPTRALLVSVYKGNEQQRSIAEEHLKELEQLAQTFGLNVIHKEVCVIRKFDAATYITSGKLEALVKNAKEHRVELIVFDDEIPPSQQTNLEKAFGLPVIDRTELILGVFAQRAQTREARLQIELAQLQYQAPRLKRLWTHLSRQAGTSGGGTGGGGGYLKGEGEKQIEIDKRILKTNITSLQSELREIVNTRKLQRSARERNSVPVFSIIGYTNAGKSTLLNALTDAQVFVENKLFATLDTTTRKFTLPNNQGILLIDTVGFIRKLPHLLVAAFRSTLEEAVQADILLHVVDISSPFAQEQAEATLEVLEELGAKEKPIITVLNKTDCCADPSRLHYFRLKYPHTVAISAVQGTGLSELAEIMIEELNKQSQEILLRIPQQDYAVVSQVMRLGNIHSQTYEEDDILLRAHLPIYLVEKLKKYRI